MNGKSINVMIVEWKLTEANNGPNTLIQKDTKAHYQKNKEKKH